MRSWVIRSCSGMNSPAWSRVGRSTGSALRSIRRYRALRCVQCLEGNRNLCPNVRFAGHGSNDGGLREYVSWPTRLLNPLPESITDAGGAVLEPLGVAIHAFDLGHVRVGASVAIVGCGPIGLLLLRLPAPPGPGRSSRSTR